MKKSIKITILAALVILDLFLVLPFLIPIPPLENVSPVQELADADSQFVEIDGFDIHYKSTETGEQPVLVFLHGFGASVYSWREIMPVLGENYRVYSYDRPAFGLTERPLEWPDEQNPYTMVASLSQLEHLLDYWEADQVILVGHSSGGSAAMEFTLANPEKVKALILVSPAVSSGRSAINWITWLIDSPQVQRLGPRLVRRISTSGLETIERAWHDPSSQPADTIPLYTKPLKAENWDVGLWHYSTTAEISNLPDRLDEFNLPILVITGDDDRIVSTERTEQVAGQLHGAELVVLPDCGHLPHEECPEAFLDAVTLFLERLD